MSEEGWLDAARKKVRSLWGSPDERISLMNEPAILNLQADNSLMKTVEPVSSNVAAQSEISTEGSGILDDHGFFDRALNDVTDTASRWGTGAIQGIKEVAREGNTLAIVDPLALSGTPMGTGITNVPAPQQTTEQKQVTDAYTDSMSTLANETFKPIVVPAAFVSKVAQVAALPFMANDARNIYKEAGEGLQGVRKVAWDFTVGGFVDLVNQPDFNQKMHDRPISTLGNLGMAAVTPLLLGKGAHEGITRIHEADANFPKNYVRERLVKGEISGDGDGNLIVTIQGTDHSAPTFSSATQNLGSGLYNAGGSTVSDILNMVMPPIDTAKIDTGVPIEKGITTASVKEVIIGGEAAAEAANIAKVSSKVNIYDEFNKIKDAQQRYEYLLDKSKTMDVSTEKNTAIFYSGKVETANGTVTARQMAERYADQLFNEKGITKLTLERTPGVKWMDDLKLYEKSSTGRFRYEELGLTDKQVGEFWRTLSSRYADGTSGAITAFSKNVPNFRKPDTIFWSIELSRLRSNSNVTYINIR